jgi:hypothetical protein
MHPQLQLFNPTVFAFLYEFFTLHSAVFAARNMRQAAVLFMCPTWQGTEETLLLRQLITLKLMILLKCHVFKFHLLSTVQKPAFSISLSFSN